MRAIAFGEVLWDIIEGEPHLGGAPFNLAAHLAKMGAEAHFVSAVGSDELGERILREAEENDIHPDCVRVVEGYPTGTVDVDVNAHGEPSYTIHENVAWDHISLEKNTTDLIKSTQWDAFAFGTLAQRTEVNRRTLNELFSALQAGHIYYDVNLRQDYYEQGWIESSLSHSTIAKLNKSEADRLASMLFGSRFDSRRFSEELAKTFSLETVIVTDGPNGALIYNGNEFHVTPADQSVKVADTVGAGDSFSAGFLFAYVSTSDAFRAGDFAARVADFVVGRSGAIPAYSELLMREIRDLTDDLGAQH